MDQVKAESAAIKIGVILSELDYDEMLEALFIVRLEIVHKMSKGIK